LEALVTWLPLLVATIAIVVPALLHRWEHGRISHCVQRDGWVRGASSVILALILAFVAALFALSAARGHLVSLGPLAVLLIILFPWHITRYVLIPLGRTQLAYQLAQLCGWIWRGDVPGGQLVAGTWALLRRRHPDELAMSWLAARRDSLPSLQAPGILGCALLEEAHGRHDHARQLIQSIFEFDEHECPPLALELAVEWSIADSAARGDWHRVEILGRTYALNSRRGRFLGAVGARLVGHAPIPSDGRLRWMWLMAPGRLRGWRLLQRALAVPPCETGTPQRADGHRQRPDPLLRDQVGEHDALGMHTGALLADGTHLGIDHLILLGEAWDQTLESSDMRTLMARRAVALRGGDPERVLRRFADEVGSDLAELARSAELPLPSLEETNSKALHRVARYLRHDLLDALAVSAEALADRVDAQKQLPALDEIREWMHLREGYERVCKVGGRDLQRVAFSQIHDPLCNLAVWLWEVRGETAIANAMFRWLLHEAVVAGDEASIALQRKNVACGA
jgi:hypothetical protein